MAQRDDEGRRLGAPLGEALRKYRLLGNSGLRVSPLCMGTMHLADPSMIDKATARRLLERFMDLGGNFFDTSPLDERGTSESWLGEFLAHQRSRAVIMTKFGGCTNPSDPNSGGNHRKCLVQSLDASLRRLGTPYVDVLLVHIWEYRTPVEEVMRSLDDIVRAGKALYVGISDTPAWKVAQCNTLAQMRGWSPFIGMSTQYSLVERTAERDILPMASDLGIGCLPWGVLSQGLLSGKYNHLSVPDGQEALSKLSRLTGREEQRAIVGIDSYRPKAVLRDWNERNYQIAHAVGAAAAACGRTPAQVAINWVANRPAVTAPIFSARSREQLDDVLGSLDFQIPQSQLAALDEVSSIDLGFPQRWGDGDVFVSRGQTVEKRGGGGQALMPRAF
jgi:aryl-alcohol dehydrogenase-like predicted oxidoreductase